MQFTVYVRDRITPQYITINGANGAENRLNPGNPEAYPNTFGGLVYADRTNLYGTDPATRVELWEDSAGTATSAEIFAACPGLRLWKETRLRAEGGRRLLQLAQPYEQAERETWGYQREEALAWQADQSVATPFCNIVAETRGIPRELFMGKVLENCILFYQASAVILGKQQQLIDQVWASENIVEFLAITWP